MIRLAALMAIMATPVSAEIFCAPRDEVAKGLAAQYSESLSGRLLTKDEGVLVEIFTGAKSWTILFTYPDGRACYVAGGAAWTLQGVPQGVPG